MTWANTRNSAVWTFTHTVSSFISNESIIQINSRIHKCQFKTWDRRKTLKQYFSAVDNNQYTKNGFLQIQLSHSQEYSSVKFRCVRIVFNAVATKASCCFILMRKVTDDTKMTDTNWKRSLDLSENKKQCCLNFWKFTPTISSFLSKKSFIQFKSRVHKR